MAGEIIVRRFAHRDPGQHIRRIAGIEHDGQDLSFDQVKDLVLSSAKTRDILLEDPYKAGNMVKGFCLDALTLAIIHKDSGDIGADSYQRLSPMAVLWKGVKIGSDVRVGMFAELMPRACLMNGSAVGNRTVIGKGTQLGQRSLTGSQVRVAQNVYIGDSVEIGLSSIIGKGIVLEDGVTIGRSSTIGRFSDLDDHALGRYGTELGREPGRIRERAVIGECAYIDNYTQVGRGALIGAGARIGSGNRVADHEVVATGAKLPPRFYSWPDFRTGSND